MEKEKPYLANVMSFFANASQENFVDHKEFYLVGVTARTSLHKELNPLTAVIGKTVGMYFEQSIAHSLSHRVNPGVTFCVYTDYESDYRGEYTYFIGEEVEKDAFMSVPKGCQSLTIPAQFYRKLTTPSGVMPKVCIDGWYAVWKMEEERALGGTRAYKADFEVYDNRALDPMNTILDIYVGIEREK